MSRANVIHYRTHRELQIRFRFLARLYWGKRQFTCNLAGDVVSWFPTITAAFEAARAGGYLSQVFERSRYVVLYSASASFTDAGSVPLAGDDGLVRYFPDWGLAQKAIQAACCALPDGAGSPFPYSIREVAA